MSAAIHPFRDWAFHRLGAPAPGAVPLIALHGFTGSGLDFAPLADALPAFDWWAPDLPGHGATGMLDGPAQSLPGMAALLEDLGNTFERPPWIFGYSMGGRLAVEIATRGRLSPAKLVLVGASPGLRTPPERRLRRAADAALAARLRAEGVEAFADYWEAQPLIRSQARIPEPLRQAMSRRRREHSAQGLALSLLAAGTGAMRDRWEDLARICCPTLLVTGAEDSKFRLIADAMAALLPDARVAVLPAAGHCAHLENGPEIVHLMKLFSSE